MPSKNSQANYIHIFFLTTYTFPQKSKNYVYIFYRNRKKKKTINIRLYELKYTMWINADRTIIVLKHVNIYYAINKYIFYNKNTVPER